MYRRSVAVLNIGCMNDRPEEQAGGIANGRAFAALDLLAGIIAANPAGLRSFHRLTVDLARARLGLAAPRSRTYTA